MNHRPLGYEPSGLPGCPTPLPSPRVPTGLIKRIVIAHRDLGREERLEAEGQEITRCRLLKNWGQ